MPAYQGQRFDPADHDRYTDELTIVPVTAEGWDMGTPAGPFVAWARARVDPPLEALLVYQGIVGAALEQLEAQSLEDADWMALNLDRCLRETQRRCWPAPSLLQLRHCARQLILYLGERGLLEGAQAHTLRKRLRRARSRKGRR